MILKSTAFENNGPIPARYTGFGEDISPPLVIEEIPSGTVSLCMIMEDPDVPLMNPFPHWILWDILPTVSIPEGLPTGGLISEPITAVQGTAWGRNRYRGPKQPPFIHKAHRYRFTLYALDHKTGLSPSGNARILKKAIRGHILESAQLTGVFKP